MPHRTGRPGPTTLAYVAALCVLIASLRVWANDGGIDAPIADAQLETRPAATPAALTAKRNALQSLLDGKLPDDLYTTELFAIDLRDEATVERRRVELAARLEPAAGDAGTMPAVDAGGASDTATLELDIDRLRLAFLRLPLVRRTAVLDAEQTARKNALDRAAATDELAQAEAEKHRAEEAQRAALAEAERAREATERMLANERARIEGARASLADQRADLSRLRSKRSSDATATHALVFALTETARGIGTGKAADTLYDRVVGEVEAARDRLSTQLDQLDMTDPAPRFQLSEAVRSSTDPRVVVARPALGAAAQAIDAGAIDLAADRNAMDWQLAYDDASDAEDLNQVRVGLLDQLSPEKHDRTLGFGEEGREQLRREVEHLGLLARWTLRSKRPAVVAAVLSLAEADTLLWVLVRAAAALVVVFGIRWIIRVGKRRLRTLPPAIVRTVQRPIFAKLVLTLVGLLDLVWSPLLVIAALSICGWLAAPLLAGPLLGVPYALVISFYVYRLIVVLIYQAIHKLQGGGAWSPAMGVRVLRSVHFIGRIAFTFYLVSQVSAAILGRGYLFHLVIRVATLVALPLALILFARWRGDIVDAYLKRRPTGWLADLVRASREKWYGFFLALAALALVLVQWLVTAVRRFALSFDQTRKALAYLFRRRLERRHTDDSTELVPLPPEVRAALVPTTSADHHDLLVPLFPEIERFRLDTIAWQENPNRVGSWIVVGKSGMGKSTWIHGAIIAAGLPVQRIVLASRITEPAGLLARFGEELGVGALDEHQIVAAIRRGPRRLFVIDDVQRLALRGVGQLEVWALLCRIIEATHDHVYWLAGCAYYADEFLSWVRQGPSVFRSRTKLARWTEPQIQTLLESRVAAIGWTVDYEDLMAIQVEPSQRAMAIANTAREYARLIWDYSEGSPRAALDCWVRSLVPEGDHVLRVRLFTRPLDRELDLLDEVSRMVLAALIWHEQLSLDHLVIALRYTPSQCDLALRQLHGANVIDRVGGSEYVVSVAWWPAVTRYLLRKHLIEA